MLTKNLFFTTLFASIITFTYGQKRQNIDRPNVILILADDMGIGDLSMNNGGINSTPNLDQLAKESVWFEKGYSASAVCAPARAALLTGRYPHRTGVVSLDMTDFPNLTSLGKEEYTMGYLFVNNGYRTGLIGKWHLGDRPDYGPLKRGFQEFVGFVGAESVKTYFDFKLDVNGKVKKYKDVYLTDVLTDSAISFVNRHKDEPFFLHLAHYAPHRPLGAPAELVKKYQSKGYEEKVAQVYAMIEVMDTGIGKLVKELDRLGIRKNTIIVFTSDNGPDPLAGKRFNNDLRGNKYEVFEGGIHIPLLINWKGKLPVYTYKNVSHFIDIFPTLASLCKIDLRSDITKRMDGESIANELIRGEERTKLNARFWQWNRGVPYYTHNAAIRDGNWKLVLPPVTRQFIDKESTLSPLLFDLSTDPTESTNVSLKHPKIYNRLKVLLENWSRKVERDRLETTSYDN